MGRVRNVLYVMYDQLRHDYLSCAGHPHLPTPNFDRLAEMGVRFTRAYTQSPVCGPARMSAYTGRYAQSHGAQYNGFPLKVGEVTLGDHLRAMGAEAWLIGKTHMVADTEGMARLGLAPDSVIGARVAECGFDLWLREDGLVPHGAPDPSASAYNRFLAAQGYAGANPWHDHANSAVDADGSVLSGWLMENARRPANIHERDSETPWLTDQAIRFLDTHADAPPWLCHLSYIKPHWPYIVPEPWASMFGPQHVLPPVRHPSERTDPHPVFAAFQQGRIGRAFARDDVRAAVIPAYMGLIAQCDAAFGRLLDHLAASGRLEDTMIILTSDHGDYLGDHWLGEKDLFHDPSVKVPLIVYDPSDAADATRGTTCAALVESIDVAPTVIAAMGGDPPAHILEGRSLLPWLRGPAPATWRRAVISEYDYGMDPVGIALDTEPRDARLMMVCDGRWKLIHAEGGFCPMLFDLAADPQEFQDLGADPGHAGARAAMYDLLNAWARRPSQRTTMSDAQIRAGRGLEDAEGIHIGVWDAGDLPQGVRARLTGKAAALP